LSVTSVKCVYAESTKVQMTFRIWSS